MTNTARTQGTVVLSSDELYELVTSAVRAALNTNASAPSEYMTLDQCAEMLQSHPRTVKKWVAGEGLAAMRLGLEYRFRRSDVITWLESRAVKSHMKRAK